MSKERYGIGIAGTILVDILKTIDKYPDKTMLANIKEITRAVGGCVPNTAINLAKIDPEVKVFAYGRTGDDENADFVAGEMEKRGIDISGIVKVKGAATSFTDVMTEEETGNRTFFTAPEANADFCGDDIDLDNVPCKILHVGYLLLLKNMDSPDAEYGTKMARFLANAQSKGIKTSIDTVSSGKGEFIRVVTPALAYCDYVVMNETECCAVAGLEPRDENGKLIPENIFKAMELFIEKGVRECVIIHCPEAGFYLDSKGTRVQRGSVSLPKGYIVGSTGAGDTFCAACLYGFYKGFTPEQLLDFGSAAAACNLAVKDAVSGAATRAEIEALLEKFGIGDDC